MNFHLNLIKISQNRLNFSDCEIFVIKVFEINLYDFLENLFILNINEIKLLFTRINNKNKEKNYLANFCNQFRLYEFKFMQINY